MRQYSQCIPGCEMEERFSLTIFYRILFKSMYKLFSPTLTGVKITNRQLFAQMSLEPSMWPILPTREEFTVQFTLQGVFSSMTKLTNLDLELGSRKTIIPTSPNLSTVKRRVTWSRCSSVIRTVSY
jgi:hypothetical protein